jgi:hypothetical protein
VLFFKNLFRSRAICHNFFNEVNIFWRSDFGTLTSFDICHGSTAVINLENIITSHKSEFINLECFKNARVPP